VRLLFSRRRYTSTHKPTVMAQDWFCYAEEALAYFVRLSVVRRVPTLVPELL